MPLAHPEVRATVALIQPAFGEVERPRIVA